VKLAINILLALLLCTSLRAQPLHDTALNFYGDTLHLPLSHATHVQATEPLTAQSVASFYESMEASGYQPLVDTLLAYRQRHLPDDWLYYQLIRRTAQLIAPKQANYHRYTLYKWYFLLASGYDATLAISADKLLFYVQCDEEIYDIPFRMRDGKQYICLNYHDYGSNIDFQQDHFTEVSLNIPTAHRPFSYKLTQLPLFDPSTYQERDLEFSYQNTTYRFRIKLNPEVKNIFANYPVADYHLYFDAPLSHETYNTLIPQLRAQLRTMSLRQGVDYLMRFTRYAFIYSPDAQSFGREKRLSPEQTLLYPASDCEDRAALFFYLVKEIYNLPMAVLAYPHHVTIAVRFPKPTGKTIDINGQPYTICEPTPQRRDLPIGSMPPDLRNTPYQVAYAYNP
jgi:hypothetical protein